MRNLNVQEIESVSGGNPASTGASLLGSPYGYAVSVAAAVQKGATSLLGPSGLWGGITVVSRVLGVAVGVLTPSPLSDEGGDVAKQQPSGAAPAGGGSGDSGGGDGGGGSVSRDDAPNIHGVSDD